MGINTKRDTVFPQSADIMMRDYLTPIMGTLESKGIIVTKSQQFYKVKKMVWNGKKVMDILGPNYDGTIRSNDRVVVIIKDESVFDKDDEDCGYEDAVAGKPEKKTKTPSGLDIFGAGETSGTSKKSTSELLEEFMKPDTKEKTCYVPRAKEKTAAEIFDELVPPKKKEP